MGLFRSCGFEELTTPKSRNDACQVAKEAYAQAEAQKEEDEGKVQVSLPPGFPRPGGLIPRHPASPWNPEEVDGPSSSSKTSSNILPEVGPNHEDRTVYQESVLRAPEGSQKSCDSPYFIVYYSLWRPS